MVALCQSHHKGGGQDESDGERMAIDRKALPCSGLPGREMCFFSAVPRSFFFFLFLPPKHKAHGVFHLAHPSTPPELGE